LALKSAHEITLDHPIAQTGYWVNNTVGRHHASSASRADFYDGSCAISIRWLYFVWSRGGYKESRFIQSWSFCICDRGGFDWLAASFRFVLFWLEEIIRIMEERLTMTPNQSPASNRRWRLPFRYRGSRHASAVARLFSLGIVYKL